MFRVHGRIRGGTDANANPHASLRAAAGSLGNPLRHGRIVRPAGTVYLESVRLPAAGDPAGFPDDREQLPADPPEHLVRVSPAEALVDHPEPVDVHNDRVGRFIPVEQVILLRVAVEVLPVVQAGQLVPLRPADQVPVFGQFDAPPYAGQDDLMPGIGF